MLTTVVKTEINFGNIGYNAYSCFFLIDNLEHVYGVVDAKG